MAADQERNWIGSLPNTQFADAIKEQNISKIRSFLSDPDFVYLNLISLEDLEYPLHIAMKTKNMEIIKLLLDNGADPNLSLGYGSSLLVNAVKENNTELVKLLLEKRANPTVDENEPLKIAVKNNQTEIASLLLLHGAKISKIYSSPLIFYPIDDANIELVELLLQYGANTEVKDNDNDTPLQVVNIYNDFI
jgi:ankyrin repeat protein